MFYHADCLFLRAMERARVTLSHWCRVENSTLVKVIFLRKVETITKSGIKSSFSIVTGWSGQMLESGEDPNPGETDRGKRV